MNTCLDLNGIDQFDLVKVVKILLLRDLLGGRTGYRFIHLQINLLERVLALKMVLSFYEIFQKLFRFSHSVLFSLPLEFLGVRHPCSVFGFLEEVMQLEPPHRSTLNLHPISLKLLDNFSLLMQELELAKDFLRILECLRIAQIRLDPATMVKFEHFELQSTLAQGSSLHRPSRVSPRVLHWLYLHLRRDEFDVHFAAAGAVAPPLP